MASFDYDVVIIGSGFGGSVAALRAAEKGYSSAAGIHRKCGRREGLQLRRGHPQEVRQVPLRFRDVLVLPPPAGLHHADPILRPPTKGEDDG
jgi:hypothetical protein